MSDGKPTDRSCVDPSTFVAGNLWADMGARPHGRLVAAVSARPIAFLQSHHIPGHSPNRTWAVGSAEIARRILLDTETFTSRHTTSLSDPLGGLEIIPIEADPPAHGVYGAIIAEFFEPKAVAALADSIWEQTQQLIDAFVSDDSCEFVGQFGKVLPAAILLSLYGLPPIEKRRFLELSNTVTGAPSANERVSAMRAIRDLLAIELEERRASPAEDILSAYAHASFGDRPLTQTESLGVSWRRGACARCAAPALGSPQRHRTSYAHLTVALAQFNA